ncbi:hypothetical protein [Pararhodobacter sp. CCB-MM2]|uniref:hypothetical protein n=1 Tax=Pararhodobacter sp. CCB-MM2 TaxID=1786003 RepID=UPI00082A5EC5|nr:hypothetical protein [Pararhodobacter sp. CCB-MM2]
MTPQFHANPFAPAISFWCSLWQTQLEQSLRLWGALAQYVPHENAAELSAEADMMKPVVRTARASTAKTTRAPAKSAVSGTTPRPAARKAALKPAPKPTPVAAPAAKVETAPAKPAAAPVAAKPAARRAPAKAKAGSEDPAKPVVH